jgi:EAL domain-containing protein (putative c-di-GMP-specific phosphodiesterase class I)
VLDLDRELREAALAALDRPGMLSVHFQPIADLTRGVVAGYEALSRFLGPPVASPDAWFAAAYAAGVGERLEALTLRRSLDSRIALPANAFLSVNVGPRALLSGIVRETLLAAGDLRGVVIEVTEQQQIVDYPQVVAVLDELRAVGAMVAVDDAGAGFASLKHIIELRPQLIKVDRGLVSGVHQDPTKSAVIETLGIFASRLDAWLLAEGIEQPGEQQHLAALGVPLAQGFFMARPSPAMGGLRKESETLVKSRRTAAKGLSELARPAPTVDLEAGAAARLFLREPGEQWVVVVDEFQRPQGLVSRHDRRIPPRPPLCVTSKDAAVDVARRIAVLPSDRRLVPLALCDDLGRFVGLVEIDRLLERLASLVDRAA